MFQLMVIPYWLMIYFNMIIIYTPGLISVYSARLGKIKVGYKVLFISLKEHSYHLFNVIKPALLISFNKYL